MVWKTLTVSLENVAYHTIKMITPPEELLVIGQHFCSRWYDEIDVVQPPGPGQCAALKMYSAFSAANSPYYYTVANWV